MKIPYLAIAILHYAAKLLNHYQYQLINFFYTVIKKEKKPIWELSFLRLQS
jgi:hypothetical protein